MGLPIAVDDGFPDVISPFRLFQSLQCEGRNNNALVESSKHGAGVGFVLCWQRFPREHKSTNSLSCASKRCLLKYRWAGVFRISLTIKNQGGRRQRACNEYRSGVLVWPFWQCDAVLFAMNGPLVEQAPAPWLLETAKTRTSPRWKAHKGIAVYRDWSSATASNKILMGALE